MATEIIDERLLASLHLRALTRDGFTHDPAAEHTAFQAGTLDALMAGAFDGDATVGEVLAHGDLGIGTVEHLGGELVVLDGQPFLVDGDGAVHRVDPGTRTPFAVVCHFSPGPPSALADLAGLGTLTGAIEERADPDASMLALRLSGSFVDLRLRSVHAQRPPYVSLARVVSHQREWAVPRAEGTLVGFRFPDRLAGVEVPGYHLHFLAADRRTGGHLLDASVERATLEVDRVDDLHVELPAGVALGSPGMADRAAIRRVEGG